MSKRSPHTDYPRWNELPYAGETKAPDNAEAPYAGSWTTYFIRYQQDEWVSAFNGKTIHFKIRHPESIDWYKQLAVVQRTQRKLTREQKTIATYWGSGVATKQWTPIADQLIDSYGVEAPRGARILAALHAAINDAFVLTWSYKFKWFVARPNQLDHNLATFLCTPRHPSYPSGHAAVAGAAETVLSYFFPAERRRLHELAEEAAQSRLYAGVHFPVDNEQGLRLGRQVGELAVDQLREERDTEDHNIDTPYRHSANVKLTPPPYEQVIPFEFDDHCGSLTMNEDYREKKSAPTANKHKPKLFY
ncbi:chloroperoxidase [Virgibacillus halodenitrificans]|uniref:Chloroperoxidase n=1 Tax=Virgibacillus halodenitrificans TaxID=1482 RepID=A0AAC9J722_VIRHA|nr:vanadium-dependent haloperoxidase [Virgibacillus halodenitrificans]APC50054.1 chloroperoxidase [Virgibacillus halodenitrificans]